MTEAVLERAAMDLMSIPPLLHRSVRRALSGIDVPTPDLAAQVSHQQFETLRLLEEKGTMPIAEIGNRLHIAKAQMTQVVDKLAELAMIRRAPNPADKRSVHISLSSRGKCVLQQHKDRYFHAVKETIAILSDQEIADLSASLRRIQQIMSVFENN